MSDFPPPPPPSPPPPPPSGPSEPPPGYTVYGEPRVTPAYAGFWIRFAAALLDGLIYGIPTSILAAAMDTSEQGMRVLTLLVGLVYFTLQEGSTGQTVGKRICGIRVVDATTGTQIDLGRAALRYGVSVVSGFVLGLGYFWMLWDPMKQTWHDKASQVVVIKV